MSTKPTATGLLFTSRTCTLCPPAKELFDQLKKERNDIELHELSAQTQEGQELGKQFNILGVPTFVFYGDGHEEPMGITGVQNLESLHKYADIALGKQQVAQKKKFSLKKLFGK